MSDKYWYDKYWKEKETKKFVEWFELDYGKASDFPEADYEQDEYWVRRGFCLKGWLQGAKK